MTSCKTDATYNLFTMIRNYIITAWRNLVKERTISIIKITGLGTGTVVIISLFTVGWQTIHAAMANPVDTLRYE